MNTKPQDVTHTPLPWQSAGCGIYQSDQWQDGIQNGGRLIGTTYAAENDPNDNQVPSDQDLANAALIVRAVNSHAALVEALKDIGLQCCQTRLAAGIGRSAKKNRMDFLLGSLRRIETATNTALALAHGTKEVQS